MKPGQIGSRIGSGRSRTTYLQLGKHFVDLDHQSRNGCSDFWKPRHRWLDLIQARVSRIASFSQSLTRFPRFSMVAVAQLVESRIVIPVVVGSSPISHPNDPKIRVDGKLLTSPHFAAPFTPALMSVSTFAINLPTSAQSSAIADSSTSI